MSPDGSGYFPPRLEEMLKAQGIDPFAETSLEEHVYETEQERLTAVENAVVEEFAPEEVAADPRDYELTAQNREDAIERVTENADAAWLESAYRVALHCMALSESEYTNTDEWWARLARLGIDAPHEPRAMAAVVRRLRSEGYIEKTESFIQSALPQGHSRNVQVWRVVRRPE